MPVVSQALQDKGSIPADADSKVLVTKDQGLSHRSGWSHVSASRVSSRGDALVLALTVYN